MATRKPKLPTINMSSSLYKKQQSYAKKANWTLGQAKSAALQLAIAVGKAAVTGIAEIDPLHQH